MLHSSLADPQKVDVPLPSTGPHFSCTIRNEAAGPDDVFLAFSGLLLNVGALLNV